MSRIRRYPTIATAEQQVGGSVIVAIGALVLGVLVAMWWRDAAPPLDRVAAIAVFALAVVALGGHVARRRREMLVVDLDARRVSSTRSDDAGWSAPLDQVGPVSVIQVAHQVPHEDFGPRREYRVVPAGRPELPLYVRLDYPAARRVAERVAREWRVGLRQADGRVRDSADLDAPMWRNASMFPAVPRQLDPDTGVSVAVTAEAAVVTSRVQSKVSTAPNYLLLGGVVMGVAAMQELPVQIDVESLPWARALWLAILAGTLGVLFVFANQVWQWLADPAVRITSERVTYRGVSLPIEDVREVVDAGGLLVLGRRRHLDLGPDFAAPGAGEEVARELRRLIEQFGRTRRPRIAS